MSESQLKQLLHQSITTEGDTVPDTNQPVGNPTNVPQGSRTAQDQKTNAIEVKKTTGLTQSEQEQVTALKSWDIIEDTVEVANVVQAPENPETSPGHTMVSAKHPNASPEKAVVSSESKATKVHSPGRSSSGKTLLRPHKNTQKKVRSPKGSHHRKGAKKRGSKVKPVKKEEHKHLDRALLKSIGMLESLQHGVQRVRAGRNEVSAVAFEHHGLRMFVATEKGEATIWPSAHVGIKTGHEVECQPNLHLHVTAAHFEGGMVATGYEDGGLMVFNAANGKRIMNTGKRAGKGLVNPGKITTCSISSDGKLVLLGGVGYKGKNRCGWIFIREIASGKRLFGFVGPSGPKEQWRNIDEDGDGIDDDEDKDFIQRRNSMSQGGQNKIKRKESRWESAKKSRSMLLFMQSKPASTFSSAPRDCDFMTMNHSGWPRTIVWGGRDRQVNVWRLIDPNGCKCELLHHLIEHVSIGAVCFSPDASLLCLGTYGGALKIYESDSGVLVQAFKDKVKPPACRVLHYWISKFSEF